MEKQENSILQGARILVAEDSRINQIVIRALMEERGMVPETVSNGKEAVEAVKKSDFDLILMDVQMPEMDGYEAVAAIREFERQKRNSEVSVSGSKEQVSGVKRGIPIVAMTAHMMDGEKQRCLDAGMDDYLSKPVDPDQMFAVLEDHIIRAENSNVREGEIPQFPACFPESASLSQKSDFPGIDMAFGIRRVGGNAVLYRKLLLAFSADYANAADIIRENLEKGNTETAGNMVHAIKGVAGNMGASELWRSAGELESCIREHPGRKMREIAAYTRILPLFEASLHQARESVASMKAVPNEEPAIAESEKKADCIPEDPSELQTVLKELAQFIKDGDTEAAESLKKLKPRLSSFGMEDLITSMETQIFDFDFEKARETLDVIAKRVLDCG